MNATTLAATEILYNERLVEEEAGHAAAALLQGLDVAEVHAPRHPLSTYLEPADGKSAGWTTVERRDDYDGVRRFAISILAPHVYEPHWPPSWPLTMVPDHGDERHFIELVKTLDLDRDGYSKLTQDAHRLTATREYELLARRSRTHSRRAACWTRTHCDQTTSARGGRRAAHDTEGGHNRDRSGSGHLSSARLFMVARS